MPCTDYIGANRPAVNKVKLVDVNVLNTQQLILRQLTIPPSSPGLYTLPNPVSGLGLGD